MMRLVYSSLIPISLSILAGCSKGPADFGQLAISWQISAGGSAIACADIGVEAVTLELASPEIETLSRTTRCDDELIATPTVPLGDYDLTVVLLDDAGVAVADETVAVELSEPELLVDLPVAVPVIEGRFDVQWTSTVAGEEGCPDGSATLIDATDLGSGELVTTRFDCERFQGLTELLPFGDYAVNVRLVDRQDELLAQGAQTGGTLSLQARVQPLSFDLEL